ncbi:hypothetical protein [Vibrio crassostreae]|uniref:hypothetical protein n=1 Tax=Vibrio crassostreae TaxID=246167 RepID=UPI001B300D7D|nr:hypothetical protein [Vibrio crassostreae]
MLKLLVHSVFNLFYYVTMLFSSSSYNTKCLVKTWIDVNYQDYLKVIGRGEGVIIVLPFPLGFKRQVNYIFSLIKSREKFTLSGMNYSSFDIINFLRFRTWNSLHKMESEAQKKFSLKIDKRFIFSTLVTMDDVDPFSIVSNYHLSKNENVKITTILHGIGTYSPFLVTNHLHVYNLAQRDYYSEWSEIDRVSVRYGDGQVGKKLSRAALDSQKIMFYSGVTSCSDVFAINNEVKVLDALRNICLELGVDFYVKLHPNLDQNFLPNCKQVVNKDFTIDEHVACSLYSTSYYTVGPEKAFLIDVGVYYLSELFGDGERIVRIDDLRKFLYEEFLVVN